MIGYLIIACEVLFWVFVLAGLVARYVFKQKKLGALLLICTPLVDLLLLLFTFIDLKNGAMATSVHGIAAIYIGVSIAFGHQMIKWADERFAYIFAGGEKPKKKIKYGKVYARHERTGWYRHLLAWCIGSACLVAIIYLVNNSEQTEALFGTLRLWSIVLVADFLFSFSYTIFPKKGPDAN